MKMNTRKRGEYFSRALGIQALLRYACSRDADREQLIARMELGDYAFDDPDARLPARCYYNLLAAAAEVLHDPWFGIHYLETAQPADIGAVGFAAMSSRTLGEALQRVARYLGYLTEAVNLRAVTHDDGTRIEWKFRGASHPAHALASEMYVFNFTVLAGRITNAPLKVHAIQLRHTPRQPLSRYRQLFGQLPTFEATTNVCVLDNEMLARPMPQANEALARFFDKFLGAYHAPAEDADVGTLLRREIASSLCDGNVTLATLASRLNLSSRTLQRELAAGGTSLRQLIDDIRRTTALDHLARNTPLVDISYLLGFRDTRSFFRAFKRWTGSSPRTWRAERTGRVRT